MKRPKKYLCRVNAAEREEAYRLMRELWEKAFTDGELVIRFPENKRDSKTRAKRLYASLANYRAKIRRRPLENLDLIAKLDAVVLRRIGEFALVMEVDTDRSSTVFANILQLREEQPEIFSKTVP